MKAKAYPATIIKVATRSDRKLTNAIQSCSSSTDLQLEIRKLRLIIAEVKMNNIYYFDTLNIVNKYYLCVIVYKCKVRLTYLQYRVSVN